MKLPDFVRIGHRGAPAFAPENTLSSFSAAVEMGIDMIEMDLRLTKDRQIAVMHDEDVGRTTNGKGRVSDLTLKQIKKLDAGSGERVPALVEVIEGFKDRCLFEFDTVSPDVLEPLINIIDRYNIAESCCIASTHMPILKTARKMEPGIMRVASFNESGFKNGSVDTAAELGAIFNPKSTFITMEIIRLCHKFGIKIFTWTVNRKENVQLLRKWGIDGIATDDPKVFYQVM